MSMAGRRRRVTAVVDDFQKGAVPFETRSEFCASHEVLKALTAPHLEAERSHRVTCANLEKSP